MCGRYKLELPFSEIVRLYDLTVVYPSRFDNTPARYNIAPTQEVAVVRLNAENQRKFVMLRWGLIPYWSKDAKGGFPTINATTETVDTKPAFRESFRKCRCLILADGFYEWMPTGEKSSRERRLGASRYRARLFFGYKRKNTEGQPIGRRHIAGDEIHACLSYPHLVPPLL